MAGAASEEFKERDDNNPNYLNETASGVVWDA